MHAAPSSEHTPLGGAVLFRELGGPFALPASQEAGPKRAIRVGRTNHPSDAFTFRKPPAQPSERLLNGALFTTQFKI
jgi:hypothetical protein